VRRDDQRSLRVVVLPDALVNPGSRLNGGDGAGTPDPLIAALVEDGWGFVKMPPHGLAATTARAIVETIAGDLVDYLRHDHRVVIVAVAELPGEGVWLDELRAALARWNTDLPPIARVARPAGAEAIDAVRAA